MPAVKTRRLSDLFKRGEPLTLDDGSGASVTVYLQKLNPVENEDAVRKANAARVRYLTAVKDHASDEFLNEFSEYLEMDREALLAEISLDDVARHNSVIEAEFAEEKGWNKDDYLQGLFDSWNDGLRDKYLATVDEEEGPDPEAKKIFDEMTRFNTELGEELEKHRKYYRSEWESKTDDKIRETLVERKVKMAADMKWLVEYRKCELLYGVREPDSKVRYFSSRAEVDELSDETLTRLVQGYTSLDIEVDEGKDSEATASSSER